MELEDEFLASILLDKSTVKLDKGDDFKPEDFKFSIKRRPILEPFPEAIPYETPELTKRLCTVDTETDPFKYGRVPAVFWVGFYDGENFFEWWGKDATRDFFVHLRTYSEPLVIYAHNGGKFDFNFFMDYVDADTRPFLINGRMVRIFFGGQEFRDSFAILPVAQGKFDGAKKQIDYDLFEEEVREQHKAIIMDYARHDVMQLFRVVSTFIDTFGWRLTIAGTALPYLQSFHGFAPFEGDKDKIIRPFYKGGRVQCFKTGILKGRYQMVDRNSMYPTAMRDFKHPISALPKRQKEIDETTAFVVIKAINRGALGMGNGLDFDFTVSEGTFFASMHEVRAGLETGTLEILKLKAAWGFQHFSTFAEFVEYFYSIRLEAKADGNMLLYEFYKLILNSAYGKLAMNTDKYRDWLVLGEGSDPPFPVKGPKVWRQDENGDNVLVSAPNGWQSTHKRDGLAIWSRPTYQAGERFLNVASAASITGASRADLWRAICASEDVVYCDTDSMICKSTSVPLGKELGEWKVEAEGDAVCIAGKKMYSFMSKSEGFDKESILLDGERYGLLKKAHKGVKLTGTQIADVCRGVTIEHSHEVPSFNMDGTVRWTKRRVKMTAKGDPAQMELEI